jgi:hypothetical protein
MTRPSSLALAIVGAVGLSLLAAGCGGGSSDAKVAQIGTNSGTSGSVSSSATRSDNPTAYSRCMRRHGVPSFPDPDITGRMPRRGFNPHSPAFQAAARACRSLTPSGGDSLKQRAQLQEQLLAFAKCMRSHRVPAFPDPQVVSGDIQLRVTRGQIDPSSPVVTAATAACRSKLGSNAQG